MVDFGKKMEMAVENIFFQKRQKHGVTYKRMTYTGRQRVGNGKDMEQAWVIKGRDRNLFMLGV